MVSRDLTNRRLGKTTLRKKRARGNKGTKRGVHCSPGRKGPTCYNLASLNRIAKYWNQHHKDKIKLTQNRRTMWNRINEKLKKKPSNCQEESCWIEQPFIKSKKDKELSHETFRPSEPKSWSKNNFQWLSTTNIERVLEQYKHHHPDYLFLGAVPIDFDHKFSDGNCVVNEICNIDLPKLYAKGTRKIGMVFNLDPHDEPGSHWICSFCNLKKGEIYYFDSYGFGAPDEVRKLLKRLAEQGKELDLPSSPKGHPLPIFNNKYRHQFKSSECGIYCIYFIEQCLNEVPFQQITGKRILDDFVHRLRSKYYRG